MYPVRFDVNRVAPRSFISNEQQVAHDFQVCDEHPLYVFLVPKLDAAMEDFYLPQFLSS